MTKRATKRGILLAILVSLSVATWYYLDVIIERQLEHAMSGILERGENSPFSYELEGVNTNIWNGDITFRGLKIEPKAWALEEITSDSGDLRMLIGMSFERLELSGFHIKEFLTSRRISVDEVSLTAPIFRYYFHPREAATTQDMPVEMIFNDQFTEANIEVFSIQDAQVQFVHHGSSGPELNVRSFNLLITEAHMDQQTMSSFVPFRYGKIEANAAGIDLDANDELYIRSDELIIDVDGQSIQLDNFQINPKYDQENFAKRYPNQKQWFAMTIDSMVVDGIAFGEFVRTGQIEITQLGLYHPNVLLYKDKTKPPPPFSKKPLPATILRGLDLPVAIGALSVYDGTLKIEEKFHEGAPNGVTYFDDLQVQIGGLATGRLATDSLWADGEAKVMGETQASLRMVFDLDSEKDEFKASGSCSVLPGHLMNKVLGPALGLNFEQGEITHLTFAFDGDDDKSAGRLDMEYEHLKVSVFKPEKAEKHSSNFFLTTAANTLIRSTNLKSKKNYRQGTISKVRRKEKDVFPFLWHSLQTGIISTLSPTLEKQLAKKE